MDWTAIAATITFTDIMAFMGVAVTAAFTVRIALKGVGMAKSALGRA